MSSENDNIQEPELSTWQSIRLFFTNFDINDHVLEFVELIIVLILICVAINLYFKRRAHKKKKRRRAQRSNTVIQNMIQRKPTVSKKQFKENERESDLKQGKPPKTKSYKKDKTVIHRMIRKGSIFTNKSSDEDSGSEWGEMDLRTATMRNYAGIPDEFTPKFSEEEIISNYRRPKSSCTTVKSQNSLCVPGMPSIAESVEDKNEAWGTAESNDIKIQIQESLDNSGIGVIAEEDEEQVNIETKETETENVVINVPIEKAVLEEASKSASETELP